MRKHAEKKNGLHYTALSFKKVLHFGEYRFFIADIGASLSSGFMISHYSALF